MHSSRGAKRKRAPALKEAPFFCRPSIAHLNLRFQSATVRANITDAAFENSEALVWSFSLSPWSMRKGYASPIKWRRGYTLAKVDLDKVGDLCLRMVRKFPQIASLHSAFVLMYSAPYWALI